MFLYFPIFLCFYMGSYDKVVIHTYSIANSACFHSLYNPSLPTCLISGGVGKGSYRGGGGGRPHLQYVINVIKAIQYVSMSSKN